MQAIILLVLPAQANGPWDSVRPSPQLDQGTITVPLNKSRVLELPVPAARISLGNPAIADILSINEREIYINGKELGTTNMILWGEGDRVRRQIGLEVTHDLQTLKAKFHQFLPKEEIRVSSAQGAVVLSGEASSPSRLDAAVRIAKSFTGEDGTVINLLQVGGAQQVLLEVRVAEVQRSFGKQMGIDFIGMYDGGDVKIDLMRNANTGSLSQTAGTRFDSSAGSRFDSSAGSRFDTSAGSSFDASAGSRVDSGFGASSRSTSVNGVTNGSPFNSSQTTNQRFNQFGGERFGQAGGQAFTQAGREGFTQSGRQDFSQNNSGSFGAREIIGGMVLPSTGAVLELLGGNFLGTTVALDIAQSQGLARILAEPNLTTLSGQKAEFLSGGEFPVPVFNGSGTDDGQFQSTSIEFEPFGIQLQFLPIVLGNGLISLKVNVSVSELSDEAALVVGGGGSSLAVPSLRKRGADATVEVPSGQTIAIAGLLSETARSSGNRYPGLGDLPVLGSLFRSQQFQKRQTELVIFVTPRLARPYDPDLVKLPTEDFVDPGDVEFYLQGRLYGTPDGDRPSSTAAGQGKGRLGPDKRGSEGPFGHDL
ncbi:pilus assembly protein N-terminal domain-containing protein [Halochromatium salexigens]|uniref:pilus assembly protein N-terminal domain-containing protein n=1 Tax=Halochromatium salexigens TaxID=49447 RepID=UPI001913A8EF|nr:pilus assembly protein N-terminal domain-containing protein [Halochromatium salexigens]